jgi:hypothetical protein
VQGLSELTGVPIALRGHYALGPGQEPPGPRSILARGCHPPLDIALLRGATVPLDEAPIPFSQIARRHPEHCHCLRFTNSYARRFPLPGHTKWVPRPPFPQTLREFQSKFATEAARQQYLAACRWPEGPTLSLVVC